MTTIQLPNGEHAEFPEEMNMDQIKSVLQKKFPPKNIEKNPSLLEKAGNFAEENFNKPMQSSIINPANSLAAGFGQGLANLPYDVANLGKWAVNKIPGVNIDPKNH